MDLRFVKEDLFLGVPPVDRKRGRVLCSYSANWRT